MADKKKQESATEGADIDTTNRAGNEEPTADPEATLPTEDAEAAAEGGSEDSAEETSGKAEGDGGDAVDLNSEPDLMDIFTDEQEEVDPFAGSLDDFLEELTMEQVAEEADRLLEEFRAI